MRNNGKYQIIPYPSEHLVVDKAGNKIVSCPTEQEAREYVTEILRGQVMLPTVISDGGMDSED